MVLTVGLPVVSFHMKVRYSWIWSGTVKIQKRKKNWNRSSSQIWINRPKNQFIISLLNDSLTVFQFRGENTSHPLNIYWFQEGFETLRSRIYGTYCMWLEIVSSYLSHFSVLQWWWLWCVSTRTSRNSISIFKWNWVLFGIPWAKKTYFM